MRFRNKLKRTAGETIAETLVALMIVALSFTFLAGAVVAAAHANASLKVSETAFRLAADDGTSGTVVTFKKSDDQVIGTVSVKYYEGNGYAYYVLDEGP